MLRYSRNKLISVLRKDEDTIAIYGILDDDIYSLEINVLISISKLELLSVDGKWKRWTTPECPRAELFLVEAEGFRIEEGVNQKIHKTVGRKACRHFANLLIECCDTAKEAAMVARWEDAKEESPDLTFEEFIGSRVKDDKKPDKTHLVQMKDSVRKKEAINNEVSPKKSGGFVVDLHIHTSPASPCSSAPADKIIEEARRIGLDGICLTDHNYVWNSEVVKNLSQKHGFMVLRGNEITTDQGDVLVFGFDRDVKGIIKLQDLRKEVIQAGGFIVVAHPFRGFLTFNVGELGLTPEKAMERPLFKCVDAVETLNGKVTERENAFALKVARGLGLPITGGSDAHEIFEVGRYATRFTDRINDEKDLVRALQQGGYSPIAFRKEQGLD